MKGNFYANFHLQTAGAPLILDENLYNYSFYELVATLPLVIAFLLFHTNHNN